MEQTSKLESPRASVLSVEDLRVHFDTRGGVLRAVEGLSFSVSEGEILAVVGESGCGKSVTAYSVLRLLDTPPARLAGRIEFQGRNLLELGEREICELRGNAISMIFQEPLTSLNPVLTVGHQIGESLRLHQRLSRAEAADKAIEMLAVVGISAPEQRVREYPHQLSGGMRQRVMIAMAIACNPKLLIADEPTTALDVTIQAQILELMRDLQRRLKSAIILITHDLGIVAEVAERVVVMYAGRKVEEASVAELFANPLHPYTRGLLGAIPELGASLGREGAQHLVEIPGSVPDMTKPIVGCPFAPRCPKATAFCARVAPAVEPKAPAHLVACHYAGDAPVAETLQ